MTRIHDSRKLFPHFFTCKSLNLKWQCHEIFCIFFYETNPPRTLINRLKWLGWKIRFRGDIREISDSAQANTACAEFCRHQFCLCRPLLALIENIKKKLNIWEQFNKIQYFLLAFYWASLSINKFRLCRLILHGVEFFKLKIRISPGYFTQTILACIS